MSLTVRGQGVIRSAAVIGVYVRMPDSNLWRRRSALSVMGHVTEVGVFLLFSAFVDCTMF